MHEMDCELCYNIHLGVHVDVFQGPDFKKNLKSNLQ